MKRKFLALLLIATIAISLSACGRTETSNESNIEKEQEEIAEEEPEQAELEEEKSKEEPEEDRPLDIEANGKLIYIMKILAAIEGGGFTESFDYNLSFINDLYALEDGAITALMYYVGGECGLPEGGHTEADAALFSVKQIENIIGSLVGHEVKLSSLANDNGWIEVYLRTDVLYTDCKNWNTEYIGNNTWKVYVDVYSISEYFSYKKAEMIYTVIENPDSILDGYSIIEVEATKTNLSEWASAYYNYLNIDRFEYDYDNLGQYYFIYLDDDDIPEIYFQGPDVPTGDSLIYYSQGEVKEEWLGWYSQGEYIDPKYINGSGLLCSNFGSQGCYGDDVIQLINGELQYSGRGYFEIRPEYAMDMDYYGELLTLWWNGDPNTVTEHSEEFNTVFEFWWNDETVSFEEYNERLNTSFDTVNADSCIYSSFSIGTKLDYVLNFLSSAANQ